jgi:hypothetical protein
MAIDFDQFLTVQTEFAVDMTCQSVSHSPHPMVPSGGGASRLMGSVLVRCRKLFSLFLGWSGTTSIWPISVSLLRAKVSTGLTARHCWVHAQPGRHGMDAWIIRHTVGVVARRPAISGWRT